MKRTFLYLATTLAIHFSALAETQVPSLMNYQGHVTNAAGVAIGTGSSVNRSVTFRFWKSATDTAAEMRLYSETQTVTILNGDFSVLIGSGAPVEGEANSAASVAEVFANKEVFLGITVDDGNAATTDTEVSPRQQLVSTAFAFRSSVAESVDSGAISNTMLAANAVDTNQLKSFAVTLGKLAVSSVNSSAIVDGSVTGADIATDTIKAEDIATGGVGSLEILDGSVTGADISNNAITDDKLGTNTVRGEETLRIIRGTIYSNGNVWRGNGFTSSKTATGQYKVEFSTAFSGTPSVTANQYLGSADDNVIIFDYVGTSYFTLSIRDTTDAGLEDAEFMFIVVGPVTP